MRGPNLPSGCQVTRQWWLGEWAECNGVCITLGKKSVNQSVLDLHKLATETQWPSFVWFHWAHYLDGTGEIHGRIGGPHNQPVQVGGPWIWRGRGSLWQAHSGRQCRELSLRLPSDSHGGETSLISKADTFSLPISCTKSSAYLLHWYHSFK